MMPGRSMTEEQKQKKRERDRERQRERRRNRTQEQREAACSTSRNSGTAEHRNTEHRNTGTSRNISEHPKNPEHPKKTGTPTKNPEHPQENPEHCEENQEHPPKNPEHTQKTSNTSPPPLQKKRNRNLKEQMARQYVTARAVSFSKLLPLIADKISYYHLRVACIQAAAPSFVPCSLAIPDGLLLIECHINYITKEFGLKAC